MCQDKKLYYFAFALLYENEAGENDVSFDFLIVDDIDGEKKKR